VYVGSGVISSWHWEMESDVSAVLGSYLRNVESVVSYIPN